MNVKSKKLPGHCVPVPFALVTDSGWLVVTSDKQHFQLNRRGLSNSRFPVHQIRPSLAGCRESAMPGGRIDHWTGEASPGRLKE
jgi:hypothetical protein